MLSGAPRADVYRICLRDLLQAFFQTISHRPRRRLRQCPQLEIRKSIPCRQPINLRLFGLGLRRPLGELTWEGFSEKRSFSTIAGEPEVAERGTAIFALVDNIHQQDVDIARLLHEVGLLGDFPGILLPDNLDLV